MRVYGIFLGAVVPAVCAVYIGSDFRGSDIRAKVCKCVCPPSFFPLPLLLTYSTTKYLTTLESERWMLPHPSRLANF